MSNLNSVNANDVVMCYWALGPTYRTYCIKNLQDLISQSKEVFKFIVLTDQVEDFIPLKESNPNFLAILDLNEERKNQPWSFELEVIPSAKIDPDYGNQFNENLRNGKRFSYSLNRFVIPFLIKNNITKFFIIDPDTHIGIPKFESLQDYINQIYSDSGLVSEGDKLHNNSIGRVFGTRPSLIRMGLNDNYHEMICKVANVNREFPGLFPQLDGIFKFYDFNTVEDLQYYFDVWSESCRISIDPQNSSLYGPAHGGVTLNDEVLLGGVYYAMKIDVYYIRFESFFARHRIENRWFQPMYSGYEMAESLEDSMQKNRHMYETDLYDFSDVHKRFPKRS